MSINLRFASSEIVGRLGGGSGTGCCGGCGGCRVIVWVRGTATACMGGSGDRVAVWIGGGIAFTGRGSGAVVLKGMAVITR